MVTSLGKISFFTRIKNPATSLDSLFTIESGKMYKLHDKYSTELRAAGMGNYVQESLKVRESKIHRLAWLTLAIAPGARVAASFLLKNRKVVALTSLIAGVPWLLLVVQCARRYFSYVTQVNFPSRAPAGYYFPACLLKRDDEGNAYFVNWSKPDGQMHLFVHTTEGKVREISGEYSTQTFFQSTMLWNGPWELRALTLMLFSLRGEDEIQAMRDLDQGRDFALFKWGFDAFSLQDIAVSSTFKIPLDPRIVEFQNVSQKTVPSVVLLDCLRYRNTLPPSIAAEFANLEAALRDSGSKLDHDDTNMLNLSPFIKNISDSSEDLFHVGMLARKFGYLQVAKFCLSGESCKDRIDEIEGVMENWKDSVCSISLLEGEPEDLEEITSQGVVMSVYKSKYWPTTYVSLPQNAPEKTAIRVRCDVTGDQGIIPPNNVEGMRFYRLKVTQAASDADKPGLDDIMELIQFLRKNQLKPRGFVYGTVGDNLYDSFYITQPECGHFLTWDLTLLRADLESLMDAQELKTLIEGLTQEQKHLRNLGVSTEDYNQPVFLYELDCSFKSEIELLDY